MEEITESSFEKILEILKEIKQLLKSSKKEEDAVSFEEAMQLLRIKSPATLIRYEKEGLLSSTAVGRRKFFSKSQINNLKSIKK
ncbi:MAG: hypothetical protein LBE11_00120 [Prevotellaceae bacterium]|jgi:DNA-binding transcriptional MerR regulator|nr:hypothetical protein [Prevotellaceae bacterium]